MTTKDTSEHPVYWQDAILYLKEKDPVLGSLIAQYEDEPALQRRSTPFVALARSIVGQQISVGAASSIWRRLEGLSDMREHNFVTLDDEVLRSAGLSRSKVLYLKNIAHFLVDKEDDYWHKNNKDDVRSALLSVKGIGEWTYQMFAIFYLLEADIFPLKDIAILRVMGELYGLNPKTKTGLLKVGRLSRKWRPYNTVAVWYLWRHLDGIPVNY